MLTSATGAREFTPLTLHGEISRTVYLLKVGGAMTGELTSEFFAAEAKYEDLRDDNIPAVMAVNSMARRVADTKGVSMSKARKMIFPQQQALEPAKEGDPQVTVIQPGEAPEEQSSPLDYAVGEAEVRALLAGMRGESPALKDALLQYRQQITTSVFRNRLASTFNANLATEGAEYIGSVDGVGTFYGLVKGDRIRFGDVFVTVAEDTPQGKSEIKVEPITQAIEGAGYLQDPTGSDKAGMKWPLQYTLSMPESQLIQVQAFFESERRATPESEPELEHPAERGEVYDNPEEALGNFSESLPKSEPLNLQTGQHSEPKSETTATTATS